MALSSPPNAPVCCHIPSKPYNARLPLPRGLTPSSSMPCIAGACVAKILCLEARLQPYVRHQLPSVFLMTTCILSSDSLFPGPIFCMTLHRAQPLFPGPHPLSGLSGDSLFLGPLLMITGIRWPMTDFV